MIGRIRGSRLLSNSAVYLGGTLVNRLFPFLLTPLYTRTMPPHEFGVWGFAMTVLNALLIVADLGIGGATTRLYWDHAGGAGIGRFLTTCFVTRIVVACGVSLGLLWPLAATWGWLGAGNIPVLPFVPLLLACAAAQAIVSFGLEVARASRDPWLFSRIQIGETILQSGAAAVLVLAGWGAVGPLAGYLAGALVVAAIVGTGFIRRYGTVGGMDWATVRETLRYGIATLPNGASAWLRRMADRIMVGRSVSMAGLAVYQLAASGMAPLTILMGSVNAAYLPYYYEQRMAGVATRAKLLAIDRLIVAALAAVSIATIAVVPELIVILAPPAYARAAELAPWFVLTAFLGGLTLQFTKELMFLKRPDLTSVVTLVPSLLGVTANLFVIPRYGVVGATLVGTVVGAVILASSIVVTQRVERTGHALWRLAGSVATVAAFAALFAAMRFAPFAAGSLATRLAAAIGGLALVALLLALPEAWRGAGRRAADG